MWVACIWSALILLVSQTPRILLRGLKTLMNCRWFPENSQESVQSTELRKTYPNQNFLKSNQERDWSFVVFSSRSLAADCSLIDSNLEAFMQISGRECLVSSFIIKWISFLQDDFMNSWNSRQWSLLSGCRRQIYEYDMNILQSKLKSKFDIISLNFLSECSGSNTIFFKVNFVIKILKMK